MNKCKVAIVDYGAGNLRSVENALMRIGVQPVITNDKNTILSAEKVIIPGVGHAANAVTALHRTDLFTVLHKLTQPVLGICLGMQLMCKFLHEGAVDGLSVFPVEVLPFDSKKQIVPHMGWNSIKSFNNLMLPEYGYFVHSYYVPECEFTIGRTEYEFTFSSAIRKDNFIGVQFHPEKSGIQGENFLYRFIYDQL